jgi:hypothetical protein
VKMREHLRDVLLHARTPGASLVEAVDE